MKQMLEIESYSNEDRYDLTSASISLDNRAHQSNVCPRRKITKEALWALNAKLYNPKSKPG